MTVAAIVGWYVLGLIGSALALEFLHRRDRRLPTDIDVGDIIFGCVMALFGPITFLVGCVFFVGWVVGGLTNTHRVVLRKHGQR